MWTASASPRAWAPMTRIAEPARAAARRTPTETDEEPQSGRSPAATPTATSIVCSCGRGQSGIFATSSLSDSAGHAIRDAELTSEYATPAQGLRLQRRDPPPRDLRTWSWGSRRRRAREAEGETEEHFKFVSGAFTENRVAGGKNAVAGVYAEGARIEAGPGCSPPTCGSTAWRSWDGKRIQRPLLSTGRRRPSTCVRP